MGRWQALGAPGTVESLVFGGALVPRGPPVPLNPAFWGVLGPREPPVPLNPTFWGCPGPQRRPDARHRRDENPDKPKSENTKLDIKTQNF